MTQPRMIPETTLLCLSCCYGCIGGCIITTFLMIYIVTARVLYHAATNPAIIPCLGQIANHTGANATEILEEIHYYKALYHHYFCPHTEL